MMAEAEPDYVSSDCPIAGAPHHAGHGRRQGASGRRPIRSRCCARPPASRALQRTTESMTTRTPLRVVRHRARSRPAGRPARGAAWPDFETRAETTTRGKPGEPRLRRHRHRIVERERHRQVAHAASSAPQAASADLSAARAKMNTVSSGEAWPFSFASRRTSPRKAGSGLRRRRRARCRPWPAPRRCCAWMARASSESGGTSGSMRRQVFAAPLKSLRSYCAVPASASALRLRRIDLERAQHQLLGSPCRLWPRAMASASAKSASSCASRGALHRRTRVGVGRLAEAAEHGSTSGRAASSRRCRQGSRAASPQGAHTMLSICCAVTMCSASRSIMRGLPTAK